MNFIITFKKTLFSLCFLFIHAFLEGEQLRERFPFPSENTIQEENKTIQQLGKEEVLSLSYFDLGEFLMERYWHGGYKATSHKTAVNARFIK